jgi:single-strand DNA-binding protein
VNKVILVGNLGRDPEVRSTPQGQPVANFTLATNRRWKDRDGNRQEHTEWHNIVCFGRQAEIAGQYLTKGKQVFIEAIEPARGTTRRPVKKYRTGIVCDNFQMLGSAPAAAGRPTPARLRRALLRQRRPAGGSGRTTTSF